MGNCLKTQLKEAVSNPNLPTFEHITLISANMGTASYVSIEANAENKVLLTATGATWKNGTNQTYAGPTSLQAPKLLTPASGASSPLKITASKEYNIVALGDILPVSGFASIKFLPIRSLSLNPVRMNMEFGNAIKDFNIDELGALNNPALVTTIDFNCYKRQSGVDLLPVCFTGSLSLLNVLVNLTTLILRNTGISGTPGDISNLTQLTSLSFSNCNQINGSIEDLLSGMFNATSNPRRGGDPLAINIAYSNVKFNNASNNNVITATFSTNGISVTDGTITRTYDGTSWT